MRTDDATTADDDLAPVRAGRPRLAAFEYAAMDVAGRDVLHLQCREGADSICLARHGARVVGLDRSPAAVTAARALAQECAVEVEYVEGDVHDAVAALSGRRFDVVYTGKGALRCLPDLPRWAGVVAALLNPGGLLQVVEFHPLVQVADPTGARLTGDYFVERTPPFDDGDGPVEPERQRFMHGVGDVVATIVGAGLRVTGLQEHPLTPRPPWPGLRARGDGWWSWPAGAPRLPLLYSVQAVRDQPDGC